MFEEVGDKRRRKLEDIVISVASLSRFHLRCHIYVSILNLLEDKRKWLRGRRGLASDVENSVLSRYKKHENSKICCSAMFLVCHTKILIK